MCSVQYLREFIKERLTAACEEIFSEVQKTVVHYEEEINRQRRLLDIIRKPDTHSHMTDLSKQHIQREDLDEQQVCNKDRNSSLDQEDPEPPQIKEEQEELCSSQEGEQLGLKQEAKGIWTNGERFRQLETIWKPEIKSDRIDLQQQHVCEEEEEVFIEQQVCNQKRNSSLDQEDSMPPQIKEEQEELCRNQEGQQLGLKLKAETLVDNAPVSESQSQSGTRKKPLQCGTCGKTFQYESHLTAHLRIHTGEKPYSCSNCVKKFSQLSCLKAHMRIHTGEKPFVCDTCGNRFIRCVQLKKHMRVHTGNYPYSCNVCEKKCNGLSTLKAHMRIHTGEKSYPCNTCGKEFSRKSSMERHVRVHTGEKRHCCNTCGKRFIWNMQLQRHMITHTR